MRRGRVYGRAAAAWVAVVLVLGVLAAVWGVTTASARESFGPHVAQYAVTTDGEVSVDLGPLGAVVLDSPLPVRLGVHVVVEEIPREVSEVAPVGTTLSRLSGDLDRYVQFFTAPDATVDDVRDALVADALRRTLVAWGVGLAVVVVVHLLLGRRRREELATAATQHRALLAGGLVVVLAGGVVAAGARPEPSDDAAARPAPVFDGTPLEGARITGRLAGVVDTVGGYVKRQVRETDAFYERVTDGLEVAWEAGATPLPVGTLPVAGTVAPGAPATVGAPVAPGAAVLDPEAQQEDPLTLLVVSDLHCDIGMAEPVARLVQLSGTDVVLDAGDTTMDGSEVEKTCVTAFAKAIGPDVPVVVADGNHDSETTSSQEREAGWTVLDGETVEVEGLRILGDSDPDATRLLRGTSPASDETKEEVAERLATTACEEEPDLLLVHNPRVGAQALEQGCVPAQVSGHLHTRTDPQRIGSGVRYISSSTAGAVEGKLTVGPLQGTAEMTLLRVDRDTSAVTGWRLVEVSPQAEVTVGPWKPWPVAQPATPVSPPATATEPAGTAAVPTPVSPG